MISGRFVRNSLGVIAVAAGLAACSSTTGSTAPASTAPTVAPGPAKNLQDDYVQVVKTVTPSVVQIETDSGLGSGIVFDNKGNIVTNAHVVEGATRFQVTFADGKQRPATLVGSFAADDIAVVHVDQSTAPAATFGDSSKLQVGDIVLAVGNPLGLKSSVSEGIVSAVGRTVSEGNGVTLPDVVQTSAAINPGNSGGALVDLTASVVGIPTLAASDPQLGGQAPGIGFAIPSNTVKDIAGQLIANNGRVTNTHRAYLGVRVSTSFGQSGALIGSVESGGPADKAGLKAGDTITTVNGKQIAGPGALSAALAALAPGQTVDVGVIRTDGSAATVKVTLGQLPGTT